LRQDIDAAIRGFEAVIRADRAGRNAQVAARDAFDTLLEDASTAIRRLDATSLTRVRGDRSAIAASERARRVDRPSRAQNGAAESAAAAPMPAATPSKQDSAAAKPCNAAPVTRI
jgi:hypothetical protein